ncbi:hypothetical protein EV286_102370 [Rhizobium sp. BK251]|nr:hypothetical protein EV286_102370 [Rhizobium sp. BK251]
MTTRMKYLILAGVVSLLMWVGIFAGIGWIWSTVSMNV